MSIFIFILISYGISNILVYSQIFEWLRNLLNKISPNFFGEMISCMMCTSTWVGFALSLVGNLLNFNLLSPAATYRIDIIYLAIFLDGVFSSGCVWLLHTIQEFFENK